MTTAATHRIRPARPADCGSIAAMIRELAVFESLESFVKVSADDLDLHLFGARPVAEAIVAEVDARGVGFALFFPTFSTFRGQPGIYLEDIYVKAEHRGRGIGKAMLARIAGLACERGCGRVEWSVLNWNDPAIGFYRSIGAAPMAEWTVYRLDDEPLSRLAASSTSTSTETTAT